MKVQQVLIQKQELKLKQMLNQRMIQMFQTFQFSYQDLLDNIHDASNENVAIEIKQEDGLVDYFSRKVNTQDNSFPQEFTNYSVDPKCSDQSLYDYLMAQVNLIYLRDKELKIATALIENVDNRGYIPNYFNVRQEIMSQLNISDRKVNDVLKIIQTFEPEGVGARTLEECLLIQLEQHQLNKPKLNQTLNMVIKHYLSELSDEKYEFIATKLSIEPAGVEAIADYIKHNFNPNPGYQFSHRSSNMVVIPSFEVKNEGDQIQIINLEQKMGASIKVSEKYLTLYQDKNTDAETKAFLKEKIQKAKELVENIQKRFETLEKIVTFVIEKQSRFIKEGPLFLVPLLQKEVSQKFSLSPSTISRILSSKFIHTPHGVYSLKQLCPRDHFGKTAERLKLIISKIIEQNPTLSDDKICKILKKDNLNIARRTITKYRLLSGIKSSYSRKP